MADQVARDKVRFYNHPMVRQSQETGQILSRSGYDHETKSMAIQSGHLLQPHYHGVYVDIPLRHMCGVSFTD